MKEICTLRRGFTLVELLVVIVIIGVLAAIALPKFNQIRNTAKETQTAANLNVVHQSLEKFGVDNNGNYPFRVRYYDPQVVTDPRFNPADWTNFPPTRNSEPDKPWHAVGLFGGVKVVDDTWADNTQETVSEHERGERKHTIVQPYGWDYNTWYRWFNQYTDPLVAQGYLDAYPENPFLRRPMGSIMYGMGSTNQHGDNAGLNHTLPYEDVVVSPGDFVYTFFYRAVNNQVVEPQGIIVGQKSYDAARQPTPVNGKFYVDYIDSYHLWAFGNLPLNGGTYVAYSNNRAGIARRGSKTKKDWDNSGTRDLFESGMISYFKTTGSRASQAKDAQGRPTEF
jgi:prepilin-type N-terminal cleavage/methylation domain-containing protein